MREKNERGQEGFDLFVHTEEARPTVAKVNPELTIGEALREAGIEPGEDAHLFVEDAPDEASRDEAEEDELDPVNPDARVRDAGLGHQSHLTCHRCQAIDVEVEYNCQSVRRKFRPTATVRRVIGWAQRRLELDESAACDLVLRISGNNEDLRSDTRLGEIVSGPSCSLSLVLVAPELVNG